MSTTRRPVTLALVAVGVVGVMVAASAPAAAKARPRADLVVPSATAGAFTATAGSTLRVVATLGNVGRATARSSVTGLYLSRDTRRSTDDRRLAVATTPAIKAGKRAGATMAGRLPSPLAAGSYSLLVCADITARVGESRETNNCRVAKTFIVARPPAPPAPSGPVGGVASTCGGTVKPVSPVVGPTGYRFAITPSSLNLKADPVGTEFPYMDQYKQNPFTLTNTGTTATPSFYLEPNSCFILSEGANGTDWGYLYDLSEKPGITNDCTRPMTLQPGQSCLGSFYADRVKRGGNHTGGLALQTFNGLTLAVFPVGVAVRSRGYFAFDTVGGTFSSTLDTGTPVYAIVKVTNVGDKTANPALTFSASGDPGFGLDPTAFDLPDTKRRCSSLNVNEGVGIGDWCWARVTFCATTQGRRTNTVYARDAGDMAARAGESEFSVNVIENPAKKSC